MSIFSLLQILRSYHPANAHESRMVADTIQFLAANPNAYSRSNLSGHITGSAWILNEVRTHVLLIHHVKLDKWLQPGGHADGDTDVLAVAMKEALEETGLTVLPVSKNIFDVDVHRIPARADVPEHLHYDIRYAFTAIMQAGSFTANREVKAARWIPLSEVASCNNEESLLRMVRKSLQ